MFIGPDVWKEKENPLFEEDASLLKSWRDTAENENLHVRIGRWNVPGHPIAVLVDFQPYFAIKTIYIPAYGKTTELIRFTLMATTMKRLCFLMQPDWSSKAIIIMF